MFCHDYAHHHSCFPLAGNFSVFGAGIDKFVQDRKDSAAAEAASKVKGFMGKASGTVTGGFEKAGELPC